MIHLTRWGKDKSRPSVTRLLFDDAVDGVEGDIIDAIKSDITSDVVASLSISSDDHIHRPPIISASSFHHRPPIISPFPPGVDFAATFV